MINKILLFIKLTVLTSLMFFLFSCGKSEVTEETVHVYHQIGVINYDSISYNLLYYNISESDSINTTIVRDEPEEEPSIFWIDFTAFKNVNELLPQYTDEEFLEKVKTLKVFRNDLLSQDTVYYGGSENYILDKENWFYSDTLTNGNVNHYYIFRFGID